MVVEFGEDCDFDGVPRHFTPPRAGGLDNPVSDLRMLQAKSRLLLGFYS